MTVANLAQNPNCPVMIDTDELNAAQQPQHQTRPGNGHKQYPYNVPFITTGNKSKPGDGVQRISRRLLALHVMHFDDDGGSGGGDLHEWHDVDGDGDQHTTIVPTTSLPEPRTTVIMDTNTLMNLVEVMEDDQATLLDDHLLTDNMTHDSHYWNVDNSIADISTQIDHFDEFNDTLSDDNLLPEMDTIFNSQITVESKPSILSVNTETNTESHSNERSLVDQISSATIGTTDIDGILISKDIKPISINTTSNDNNSIAPDIVGPIINTSISFDDGSNLLQLIQSNHRCLVATNYSGGCVRNITRPPPPSPLPAPPSLATTASASVMPLSVGHIPNVSLHIDTSNINVFIGNLSTNTNDMPASLALDSIINSYIINRTKANSGHICTDKSFCPLHHNYTVGQRQHRPVARKHQGNGIPLPYPYSSMADPTPNVANPGSFPIRDYGALSSWITYEHSLMERANGRTLPEQIYSLINKQTKVSESNEILTSQDRLMHYLLYANIIQQRIRQRQLILTQLAFIQSLLETDFVDDVDECVPVMHSIIGILQTKLSSKDPNGYRTVRSKPVKILELTDVDTDTNKVLHDYLVKSNKFGSVNPTNNPLNGESHHIRKLHVLLPLSAIIKLFM